MKYVDETFFKKKTFKKITLHSSHSLNLNYCMLIKTAYDIYYMSTMNQAYVIY